MRIGILGTRGIPNYHGGFEQFAEFFAVFLAKNGHETYVYTSSKHPYQKPEFQGVHLIHCKDPEYKIGTAGQFIYDLNCILDARKRNFDILLQLGYTSNSIWHWLLPKKAIIVTNMDGLEWKRSKYNKWVRRFLKFAERWAVKSSDYLIADSKGIQAHLKKTYRKDSEYIAYGASCFFSPNPKVLETYQVEPENYHLLIARMEPENNIETILEGAKDHPDTPFLVVGKHDVNSFGKYLTQKYQLFTHIRFLGGIYDLEHLNNLRYYSKLYFHGHSVGGTNPSLLEAMASNALVVAHQNEFNKAILEEDALYFETISDVSDAIKKVMQKADYQSFLNRNQTKVQELYSWENINRKYLGFFKRIYEKGD
ncbi:MAG: DUF1972 domain-containing protein [Flavobacteriaceae bacterium]